jgi:hypothetical protein
LTENGLGYNLGDFFTNSSGHPGHQPDDKDLCGAHLRPQADARKMAAFMVGKSLKDRRQTRAIEELFDRADKNGNGKISVQVTIQ